MLHCQLLHYQLLSLTYAELSTLVCSPWAGDTPPCSMSRLKMTLATLCRAGIQAPSGTHVNWTRTPTAAFIPQAGGESDGKVVTVTMTVEARGSQAAIAFSRGRTARKSVEARQRDVCAGICPTGICPRFVGSLPSPCYGWARMAGQCAPIS